MLFVLTLKPLSWLTRHVPWAHSWLQLCMRCVDDSLHVAKVLCPTVGWPNVNENGVAVCR